MVSQTCFSHAAAPIVFFSLGCIDQLENNRAHEQLIIRQRVIIQSHQFPEARLFGCKRKKITSFIETENARAFFVHSAHGALCTLVFSQLESMRKTQRMQWLFYHSHTPVAIQRAASLS